MFLPDYVCSASTSDFQDESNYLRGLLSTTVAGYLYEKISVETGEWPINGVSKVSSISINIKEINVLINLPNIRGFQKVL